VFSKLLRVRKQSPRRGRLTPKAVLATVLAVIVAALVTVGSAVAATGGAASIRACRIVVSATLEIGGAEVEAIAVPDDLEILTRDILLERLEIEHFSGGAPTIRGRVDRIAHREEP
jgi:hypothetical protein